MSEIVSDIITTTDNFTFYVSNNPYELFIISPLYDFLFSFPLEINQQKEKIIIQENFFENSSIYQFLKKERNVLFNEDCKTFLRMFDIDIVPHMYIIMSELKIDVLIDKDRVYVKRKDGFDRTLTGEDYVMLYGKLIDMNILNKIYRAYLDRAWGMFIMFKEDLLIYCLTVLHDIFENGLLSVVIPTYKKFCERIIHTSCNNTYIISDFLYVYAKFIYEKEKYVRNEFNIYDYYTPEREEKRYSEFNRLYEKFKKITVQK